MQLIACDAPRGLIEPAPLTDLPLHIAVAGVHVVAFWTGDDEYVVRAQGESGTSWYRGDTGSAAERVDEDAQRVIGALMADIIPMGLGRVLFPVGSTGRTVFRVWRVSNRSAAGKRTRILGVRAGRSRRLPA